MRWPSAVEGVAAKHDTLEIGGPRRSIRGRVVIAKVRAGPGDRRISCRILILMDIIIHSTAYHESTTGSPALTICAGRPTRTQASPEHDVDRRSREPRPRRLHLRRPHRVPNRPPRRPRRPHAAARQVPRCAGRGNGRRRFETGHPGGRTPLPDAATGLRRCDREANLNPPPGRGTFPVLNLSCGGRPVYEALAPDLKGWSSPFARSSTSPADP